ncbi:MAG: MerR family transcriptional regulator [Lachnospiraceae bacterium]|nr:MerR family transcriptional regulator [Lachnospiraceae bacterium]
MHKKYSIGEASKACNIPIKTLRYYDSIGLLKPKYRNQESNYRYYSKEQLTTLLIIRRLRAQGFSLKDIQDLITNTELENLKQHMLRHCDQLDLEISLLQIKKESCKSLLKRIHEGAEIISRQAAASASAASAADPPPFLSDKIQVEFIPKSKMIYSREIMKQYRNADVSLSRWIDIYDICTELGFHMKSPIIVTFHNHVLEQFLMKDCDVEFGVCIESEYEIPKKLPKNATQIRDYGGYKAATLCHIGPYGSIMQSHVALLQWINQNGYELLIDQVSEEFVVSPLDVNDESRHVTKVIMPIRNARQGNL